ncbi:MAG: twin-arginine translocase TatA/TatE family subunit [Phycisphaerae bacterium]|nr:twin-arginine translocase TatA/TatE family subunit [Phycisphaerae bacterium]
MAHSSSILLIGMPGGYEIWIILAVALLIFGKRLPEIARGMGKSMTEFKKGLREVEDVKQDVDHQINEVKSHAVNEVKEAAGLKDSDIK